MLPSAARVAARHLARRGVLQFKGPISPGHPEWGSSYKLPVSADRFVHFTTSRRADEILEAGRLLMNPPYKKMGIDVVNGISTIYGAFVPGVQLSHVRSTAKKELDHVVALVFKTNTRPDYGRREEVVWTRDVVLKGPRVLPLDKGASLIMGSPERIEDDDLVNYT